MSFFSAQNFIAPFKSKVHLVTIVMVALIFAVWRLNSGGFRVELSDFRANGPKETNKQQVDEIVQPEQAAQAPASESPSYPSRSNNALIEDEPKFDRLLTNSAVKEERAPERSPDNSLADIERSLGLR